MARSSIADGSVAEAIPLISVITSFLNAERYVEEAIGSVLAQTWHGWELILVDDGSSDGSTAIARAYAARYPGAIRYVEHAGHLNRGISASRNVGVAHSRGAYLAFLDADDVFLPERLERHVTILESRRDLEAVFADSQYWHSWTGDPADADRDVPRHVQIAVDTTFEAGELLSPLLRALSFTPAVCSVLVRRHAFERIGGFEESFRDMYEDQAFFYKLFLHCRTQMTAGVFDRYRQHPESCCAVADRAGTYREKGSSPARRRFLDWLAEYLRRTARSHLRLRCLVEARRWLERHPDIARRAYGTSLRTRRALARFRTPLARRASS